MIFLSIFIFFFFFLIEEGVGEWKTKTSFHDSLHEHWCNKFMLEVLSTVQVNQTTFDNHKAKNACMIK